MGVSGTNRPLPGCVLRGIDWSRRRPGGLTTDCDGLVIDCYGFRSLGPVRYPPWRVGLRPINVTFRMIRPMSLLPRRRPIEGGLVGGEAPRN
jgi:hypothetical protein